MSRRTEYIEKNNIDTNDTTIFLLPSLGFSKTFYGDDFISAYLIDVLKPKLALVFKNNDSESLKESIEILQTHEEYVESYYDDEDKELVVILKFPKVYKDDLLKFKKGRFKEFSNDFKELLLDVHGRITGDGKCIYMVDVLHPDYKAKRYKADQLGVSPNELPNGEVRSIPDYDKERYMKVDELLEQKKIKGSKYEG